MAFLSFLIVLVQRALLRERHFIHAPSIILPLAFITVVVAVTAKLTGGIGLGALGGGSMGGKRYLMMFGAFTGFLAMISARIPPEKVKLYLGLFFVGQLVNAIGTFAPFMPGYYRFLFLVFPVETAGYAVIQEGATLEDIGALRPWGVTVACVACCYYMLARFGIKGILEPGRYGRVLMFGLLGVLSLFGGYRSFLILLLLTCAFLFFFEGLVRSRYMILVVMLGYPGRGDRNSLFLQVTRRHPKSLEFPAFGCQPGGACERRSLQCVAPEHVANPSA